MSVTAEQSAVEIYPDGVATIREATVFLRVSRSFLYKLMDRGDLAYCRFGAARRVPWAELRRYVAAQTTSLAGAK